MNKYKEDNLVKDTTRKALIEIGSTVVTFAMEVWRKLENRKSKK